MGSVNYPSLDRHSGPDKNRLQVALAEITEALETQNMTVLELRDTTELLGREMEVLLESLVLYQHTLKGVDVSRVERKSRRLVQIMERATPFST